MHGGKGGRDFSTALCFACRQRGEEWRSRGCCDGTVVVLIQEVALTMTMALEVIIGKDDGGSIVGCGLTRR